MCDEHAYMLAGLGLVILLLLALMWHMHKNGGKLGFLAGFEEVMCGACGGTHYGGPCAPRQVCEMDAQGKYTCA